MIRTTTQPESPTLSEWLVTYALSRDVTDKTVYQYTAAIKSLNGFLGRKVRLSELNPDDINRWLIHLSSLGQSPHTVNGRRRHIIALWRAAYESDLVPDAPKRIRTMRAPLPPPFAWTVDEVRTLLKTAETMPGCYEEMRMWRNDWWSLYIRLGWDTGLRTCDLLALRFDQLQDDGGIMLSQHKTGRWHLVRIHKSTAAKIKAVAPQPRKLLLPWPYTPEHLRFQWQRVISDCQTKGPLKRLRKSSASNVELHFPGAGALHLGHARGIAQHHYLDPRITAPNRPMPEELTIGGAV